MSIIIFIIILALLILVHEFGHFIVAKKAGIRVDEFGIGFPPRVLTLWEKNGTKYTLNTIPFGGFVKIFGETPEENGQIKEEDKNKSLISKSKWIQAAVLIAGVTFNLLFAWLLISVGYMSGLPTSVDNSIGEVKNVKLIVTNVINDSPASKAGIRAGDTIVEAKTEISSVSKLDPQTVSEFIQNNQTGVSFVFSRGKEILNVRVVPEDNIISDRKAIGISMDNIGTLQLSPVKAFWEGARTTIDLTKVTVVGLSQFLWDAVKGKSDLSQVTGPVGIVGIVGEASQLGFIYILSFTAFISINLAVINMIPFPAIDGGRLLFVAIEAIKGSPIKPKVANTLNALGFILLILLMFVVTVNDVIKLF